MTYTEHDLQIIIETLEDNVADLRMWSHKNHNKHTFDILAIQEHIEALKERV